ncbi:MAG: cytochrome c biogenesis CcdA family protein [Acidimicrobiales bacterium]
MNLVTYLLAFGAGVISFASPCVLPIVPGYLSIITGLDIARGPQGAQGRIARDTIVFIAGFGSVFVLLGVSVSTVGQALFQNQLLLTRISGAMVLGMALFMLASLYVEAPWMYQEKRFHPELGRFGRAAPGVAGVAFGFGWTPCIGPVLASILALAATSGGATTGASLLAVYSLGLGVPFLITGLAFARMAGAMGFVKTHMRGIVIISSLSMAFIGVILIFNRLIWITSLLQDALRAVGLEWLVNIG